jgi:signal transduction histidine kinase
VDAFRRIHWQEQVSALSNYSRKLRPPLVLLIGFGGLLTFIVGAALGTIFMLDRVRDEDRRTRQAFIERLGELEQIRSQIYLSGTYVRDFLLSPDAGGAEEQRARLSGIEQETRALLERYRRLQDGEEQDTLRALDEEISAYWQLTHTTFNWNSEERDQLRYSFFYEQLVPRRTTMLQIADQIGSINHRGLARAEERFAMSEGNLRGSLIATFALTLLGGTGLALTAGMLTVRLEKQLEKRGQDLQELSARLVRTQEEERRMLARELHDEVGQSLSAIMMEAGNAALTKDPAEARERLSAIGALAGKTLHGVRDLALLLRPSMLDDFGLVPALDWHAREVTKRTGLPVRVTAGDDCDELPDEHKTCIYRLVQEALHNAARHAAAHELQVNVRRIGGRVLCSVQDDGAGFDKRRRGLGLLGMEERVRRLGGKLEIETSPGRGTAILADLPVEAHAANSHSAG